MRAVAVMPRDEVSAADTLLQIYAADADRPLKVTEIGVSFFGQDSTHTPIHLQLVRQSDAGSGGTAVTPVKTNDQTSDSVQATALRKPDSASWGGEPTSVEVLREWAVHPQAGLLYPVPDPETLVVDGGDRLAIKVATSPDAATPMCAYIEWEE